ncbi:MAG: peptidase T4 [Alphaproteobacteria bacterium]|nr:MAG: peptidase T4 [Alphaproteobacteria bacterium]
MSRPGPRNLVTDVAGLAVGNSRDERLKSGVTAVVCDEPAVAAVHVMGGAPGTRETDLLAPENTVERVDAVVLSGGSAYGLDAAAGAQAWLRGQGRGLDVGGHRVPIVPAAILFDLANGGDKDWGLHPPYRELGHAAAAGVGRSFELGSVGAGCGATTAGLKGGLGSASALLGDGATVGALVAVNPIGSVIVADTGRFWAAPFEVEEEFGGRGLPAPMPPGASEIRLKYRDALPALSSTTLAVIATDATLSKAQAKRLAVAAHDGFARAIWPAHTPHDGDLVFALATGRRAAPADAHAFVDLCAAAAATVARAIARGVYAATPAAGDPFPTWRGRFG